MTRLSLRALTGIAASSALAACMPFGDLSSPEQSSSETPRTAEGVSRELNLSGLAFAPMPVSKYAGSGIRGIRIEDGVAYCLTETYGVYAVSIADGTPKWMLQLDNAPTGAQSFARGADRIGFLSRNHITAVKTATGARVLDVDLSFTPSSAGILTEDSFYAGAWGEGYRLRSATLIDGWSGWAFETADAITSRPLLVGTGAERLVVFASHDGRVVALEPRPASGARPAPSWVAATTGRNTADLAADEKNIFVASEDGVLYAFSRAAGAVRWKWYGANEPLIRGPVAANGRVYQPINTGFAVLDAESGSELHRVGGAREYLTRIGDRDFYLMPDFTIAVVEAPTGVVLESVYCPLFVLVPSNPSGGTLVFSDGSTLYAMR